MEYIELKKDGPVTIVVMDHAAENTFTGPFVDEIMGTLDELEKDPEVKAALTELGQQCRYLQIMGSFPRAGD